MKQIKLAWNVLLDFIALLGWFLLTAWDTLTGKEKGDL